MMLASYRGLAARLILDRRSRFYTFNMPKAADDLAAPAFRHPPRQRQGRNSECCLGEGDEGGSIHFARGLELRLAGRHRQDSDMTIIRRGSQAVACPPTRKTRNSDLHIQQTLSYAEALQHSKQSDAAPIASDGTVEGRDQGGQQFGGRCRHGPPTSGAAPE